MLRIGQGFDIHQLVDGQKLILGGVVIPHPKGLLGHSDADVLIHAIIDALIGALALGDIGKFFPDTSSTYKDANSRDLLRLVINQIRSDYDYRVNNVDSTIIIEQPKLRDYIEQMRINLASDLGVDLDQISIKAKTHEQMDSVGQCNSAIAHAVVLLIK